jgi:ABC-2 type transport system permease protein
MRRYLRLLVVQVRASLLLSLQYRWDFLVDGGLELFWTATAIVPLLVVFQDRAAVAGWSVHEAFVVVGWFTLLNAILEGVINPSLGQVVEHVRKGTLDFVLLKPVDAQFLVSTARFSPWKATSIVAALAIFAWAFAHLGRAPTAIGVATALVLLGAACAILYAITILTVAAAFVVVRIDNLTYLFSSIFDAARWPASVFRGALRVVVTFVVPLAMMTTWPAEALLGRGSLAHVPLAVVFAAALMGAGRFAFRRALSRYTSASS